MGKCEKLTNNKKMKRKKCIAQSVKLYTVFLRIVRIADEL